MDKLTVFFVSQTIDDLEEIKKYMAKIESENRFLEKAIKQLLINKCYIHQMILKILLR